MKDNVKGLQPDLNDPGLEDGGEIGALPQFAPPEPEAQPAMAAQTEALPTQVSPVEKEGGVSESAAVADDSVNEASMPSWEMVGTASRFTGVLMAHGEAPFNFDKDENASYWVKYRDDAGEEKLLWGLDLKRAIHDGGIEINQRVEFANVGQQMVQVHAPIRDEQGKVIRYEEKEAIRKRWEVRLAPALSHDVEAGKVLADKGGQQALNLEDQLRQIASQILAERGNDPSQPPSHLTDDELERVASTLKAAGGGGRHQPAIDRAMVGPDAGVGIMEATSGQRAQLKGGAAIVEGVSALVGGAMNLAGTAGKTIGQAANLLADAVQRQGKPTDGKVAESHSSLPSVLPRLSEYRITQVEKAASNFGQEMDAFWGSSTKLTALKTEIERIANERGISVQDVNEKMKPGGELSDLRQKFNEAVSENPDATARKKGMDKALDSYIRQYGRAQEELLNPEQQGNLHYDKLKQRLELSQKDMEKKSSNVPAFANTKGELDPSHFERLQEAVAKIAEKLKEVAKEFISMIRGKTAEGDNDAPAP